MARIYSVELADEHDVGGVIPVIVDPGFVWVVRDVTIFLPGPEEGGWAAVIGHVKQTTIFQASADLASVSPRGDSFHWSGRQVFTPQPDGWILDILGSGLVSGPDVRISGYRLVEP